MCECVCECVCVSVCVCEYVCACVRVRVCVHNFSRLVAMIKPKVGVKFYQPESLVFSYAKILFLVSLLFAAVKDRSLLLNFLNF